MSVAEYWECPPEVLEEITGGCGPGGLGDFLVPDKLVGLSVKPACSIHDVYYSHLMPGTIETKREGDRVFKNNMFRIIDARTEKKWLRRLRKWFARQYYQAVRDYGGRAFWENKNPDNFVREVEV